MEFVLQRVDLFLQVSFAPKKKFDDLGLDRLFEVHGAELGEKPVEFSSTRVHMGYGRTLAGLAASMGSEIGSAP